MGRLLVVGPGYVGARLAGRLAADGHDVFTLSRRPVVIPGVVSVTGDLTAGGLELPEELDVAFFTAAPDASSEDAYRATYVSGLDAVRGAAGADTRVVFTSSTAVYGESDDPVDESTAPRPGSFRGEVLLEAESRADLVVRLSGIYGPGRTRALDRLRSGEARYAPGRYLNLIHRDDAAGALHHVTGLAEPERVYIGVDDEPVASEELFRFLAERIGVPMPEPGPETGANKRLTNRRLRDSGYELLYPTFREGYGALFESERRVEAVEPCPASPNCVSTEAEDDGHRMPGVRYVETDEAASAVVVRVLARLGGRVTESGPFVVRAEFRSAVFRFVDDVVVVLDDHRVRFRSASRVGYSDLGVNRRRMERFTAELVESGGFAVA